MILRTFGLKGYMNVRFFHLGKTHITIISPKNLHEPASYHEVGTDDELFDNSVVYWEVTIYNGSAKQQTRKHKKHQPWHHIRPSAALFRQIEESIAVCFP